MRPRASKHMQFGLSGSPLYTIAMASVDILVPGFCLHAELWSLTCVVISFKTTFENGVTIKSDSGPKVNPKRTDEMLQMLRISRLDRLVEATVPKRLLMQTIQLFFFP